MQMVYIQMEVKCWYTQHNTSRIKIPFLMSQLGDVSLNLLNVEEVSKLIMKIKTSVKLWAPLTNEKHLQKQSLIGKP